jgi:hypothetical protein
MSKFFKFLEEASDNVFLGKVRVQVMPLKGDPVIAKPTVADSDEDSESDAEEGESEPDEEIEDKKEDISQLGRAPKKPTKRNSQFMVDMIKKYEPKLKCNSDTKCLLVYAINNIDLLQKTYGQNKDDLTEFTKQLEKLQKIISHLYPSTSTKRNMFTDYTGAFKLYYVNKPFFEHPTEGLHMKVVRNILHADKAEVVAYLSEKEKRLHARLRDKYVEDYDDVSRKVLKMQTKGSEGKYKKDSVHLLLAIMTCVGCRKTEILDPNCKFYTYEEYQDVLLSKGLNQEVLRLGTWKSPTEFDEEHSFEVTSKKAYKKLFDDYAYTICQSGVLKDKGQAINAYLISKDDKRFVENKLLIKPSIILNARQVVDMIKEFREINDITEESFENRKKAGSRFSTREIKPIMTDYFPKAAALSLRNNWEFGTHYCRKIWANASYLVYENKIKMVTGKYVDKSIWCSNTLGHSGSLATSLSYMNCQIVHGFDPKVFEIPTEELLRI